MGPNGGIVAMDSGYWIGDLGTENLKKKLKILNLCVFHDCLKILSRVRFYPIFTAYSVIAKKRKWRISARPQSTYIYRAPQCMSPRWNWDSPTPSAASECALPPGPKGGGAHSPAAKGVGGVPIPTTGETLSTLPTLWARHFIQMDFLVQSSSHQPRWDRSV